MRVYDIVLNQPSITSNFGERIHPITGKQSFHDGTDLISNAGDRNLYALEDGYVLSIRTGQDSATTGYGNTIWVRYPRIGKSLFYAHCSQVLVSENQQVSKGTVVGIMGSTGAATGVHLHLGMQNIGESEWLNTETYDYDGGGTTPTVERDENKDQLKVNTNNLRIRDGAGITANVLGYAQEGGIYNYYQIYNNDGYDWYRIADNQWVANVDLEIYPKKQSEVEILKKQIEELNQKITELNNEITLLKEENENLKKENEDLRKQLEEKEKVLFSYDVDETCVYKIKLNQNERLIIKEKGGAE